MKKFLITLALCASMTTASVSAATFGVCTHMGLGDSYDNISNIQSVRDTKVEWIRDECRWDYMQSTPGGSFTIRSKDIDYMKRVEAAGINHLLLLSYGNDAYGVEKDTVFPTQDNMTYYNGYLDYVRYTVGQVKDYVDAYEIWNEPNINGFNYNLLADGTDYAKLYLDAKAIIDELDPTAMVVCGAITGAGDADTDFGKAIFDYVKKQGDVNSLIDAFSIHLYTQLNDEVYVKGLSEWEGIFDSYGYTGEVWMTENGVTADNDKAGNESDQAAMVAKLGIQWENYLNDSGRNGISFWYDLRNDVGISDYEDNFGLVDSSHNLKPSGYAMIAYNSIAGDKKIESLQKIKTKDNLFFEDEYGYVAKYGNSTETAYIVYDSNGNGKSTDVTLSGDVAYVYDYLGNVTETIQNPSGTKSVTVKNEPTYIECITYKTIIEDIEYDDVEGILSVSGTTNYGDTVTVELLKDGEVVSEFEALVKDGSFAKWFSVLESGNYTVRVGNAESSSDEYSVVVSSGPEIAAGVKVVYDAEAKKVNVSGNVENSADEQYVTLLAIPESMDISSIDMNAIAFMKQIPVTDGAFDAEFVLPEYYTAKTAVYIGGTKIDAKTTAYADIPENPYLYVASFEVADGDRLSATAVVRNYGEEERKVSVVIVQYGTDGKLEKVTVEEKTVPGKTYVPVECTVSGVEKDGDALNAKAFIWSDMTGLVPLFDSDEISLG